MKSPDIGTEKGDKSTVLGEALITDEGLSKLRARIGLYYRISQNNEAASRNNIRRYAEGIGDFNPLWLDEGYASRTKYKSIIAPPTFLYGVFLVSGHPAGGLPGVHGFFSGGDWEWFRVMCAGDVIAANYRPVDVVEKSSAFAVRTVGMNLSPDHRPGSSDPSVPLSSRDETARRLGPRTQARHLSSPHGLPHVSSRAYFHRHGPPISHLTSTRFSCWPLNKML